MAAQPPAAEPAAEDSQYYRRVLHELIDMGMDLARIIHAGAKAEAETQSPEHARPAGPAAAFDRISRAVRRTITLARHLDEPAPSAAGDRAAARRRIIREVEDAIQRQPKRADKDRLHAEMLERLDGPDLDADIFRRPIPEIIAEICRDLGIAAAPGPIPWKRRTPADIAALCARAARPHPANRAPEPERFFRLVTPNSS